MLRFEKIYVFVIFILSLFYTSVLFSQISFKPTNISGLSLWLKGDSGVTLNGANVSQWNDLSGNGNNVVQSVVANQPLYVNNIAELADKPSIQFDGTDDFLSGGDILDMGSKSFDFYIVAKINDGNSCGIITKYDNLSDDIYSLGFFGNQLYYSFYSNHLISNDIIGQYKIYNPKSSIQELKNKLYVNGVNTGITTNITLRNRNSTANFKIGASDAVFGFLNGDICEVLIYDTLLNDSLRNLVEQYLSNKYNPPINFGYDVAVLYGFCPVTIYAPKTPWFNSYLWNTGSTTDSTLVNQAGNYSVIVNNTFNFLSSDTINVTFPGTFKPFPDTTICYGDTLVWNTQLNKTSYSFLWQNSSTDSVFKITAPGQYYIKVTDTLGCIRYSDTITVAVDNFPQIVTLGPDTTHCAGEQIALTAGASQAVSYLWSTSATTSSITVTSSGNYSLTVTNAYGCSKTDDINVTVKGVSPAVNFLFDTICFGDSTSFKDISVIAGSDSIAKWNWNFGDTFTDSVPKPLHAYAIPGNYTATLTLVTDSGCSNTSQKPVIVPDVPAAIFNTSLACSGDSVFFTDISTVSNSSIVSRQWDFGDPVSGPNNFSSAQFPAHIFNSVGSYIVQLIVTSSFGCKDTTQMVVNVLQSPTAVFSYTTVCAGMPVSFTDNSTSSSQWNWDFGDAANSNIKNPAHAYSIGGTYPVKLIITDANGCKDTSDQSVPVYYRPKPGFTSGNTCKLEPFQFMDTSSVTGSTITQWKWSFGTIGNSILQNPVFVFPNTGATNVKLVVTSQQGCVDSITKSITTFPAPSAYFTASVYYGNPPVTITFTNLSGGGATYLWDFGDSGSSTSTNPSHTFTGADTFQVMLVTISPQGCHDTAWEKIFVWEELLDIAVTSVSAVVQGNTITVSSELANKGTRDIAYAKLIASIENGGSFQETWSGLLKPGESTPYNFNAAFELRGSLETNYFCVEADAPNGETDDVPSNNKKCAALSSNTMLLNPFPNPVSGNIAVFYNVPSGGEVEFEIYDAIGRRVEKVSVTALKGLNLLDYDAGVLANGAYALRMYYNSKIYVKVFVKR